MNSLSPKTYESALEKAQNRPVRPRKPLARKSSLKGNGLPGSGNVSERTLHANKGISAKGRASKKRTKLPSRKKLIQTLDSLTSQIVRLRDRCCVLCSTTERLQCGHIFGRRSHGARFDITDNGNCHVQCAGCNQRHNYDPNRYFRWYINRFGQESFDELYTRWAKGRKYSQPELREMITRYQTKLESLQKEG
jgi:Bacteriophage Lambda NinG protein.